MATYRCANNHVYDLPYNNGKIVCTHTTPEDICCEEPSFLKQEVTVDN